MKKTTEKNNVKKFLKEIQTLTGYKRIPGVLNGGSDDISVFSNRVISAHVIVTFSNKGIVVELYDGNDKGLFSKTSEILCYQFSWNELKDIQYKKIDLHSETKYKEKSVMGRAIVGGVLGGGVGAVVGGMSGVGNKKVGTIKNYEQHFLFAFETNEGNVLEMKLKAQNSSEELFTAGHLRDLQKYAGDKFGPFKSIDFENKNETSHSNLDEIKKLKELLDSNAITIDEFEAQKKKLLQ